MYIGSFFIKESDGINFAKLSRDKNIIHTDKIAGYNSIYGYHIVHGALIILKFLKKIKFKKNYSFIKIQFQKGFKYDFNIKIKIIKKNKFKIIYKLIQQNNTKANIEIGFLPEKYQINNLRKITLKKKIFYIRKNKKKIYR